MKANNIWFHYLTEEEKPVNSDILYREAPYFLVPEKDSIESYGRYWLFGLQAGPHRRPTPSWGQGGLRRFAHLPTSSRSCSHYVDGNPCRFPGAIAQANDGPMDWPGPPGSMLPEPSCSFRPKATGFGADPLNGKSRRMFPNSSFISPSFLVVSHHPGNTCNIRAV